MRVYAGDDESAIRTERQVREWTRSGLLEKAQQELILPRLKVDLRRTNFFFRLTLFAFGLLIILSSVLLVGVTSEMRDEVPIAILCMFGAVGSFALAEFLIANFRLYRFGIEEAAAVAGGFLCAVAAAALATSGHTSRPGEDPILVGLIVGTIVAFAVYVRYGYVYAAVISMLCMSAAPFAAGISEVTQRLMAAGLLTLVFVAARSKRVESVIQAMAWLGIYAYLNLHLSSFGGIVRTPSLDGQFYSFTYVAIWVLPAIGLFLGLRNRDRPLLDVSIVLGLVTLATNKPYLGAASQTWDPIVLGVFLIVTAVVLRRWLSKGDHGGLTAARILLSDKRGISAVATLSAALHTVPKVQPGEVPPQNFEGGGGGSGGAGASGSF